MNPAIISTGYYLPEKVVTNFDLERLMDTSNEWIESRTGIRERRVAEDMDCSDLATKAAIKAVENSPISMDDIDGVVVATITGDYIWPSTASIVQNKLGLENRFAFDVSAACSGFIYGLSLAKGYIGSGMYNNILVIGVEKFSSTLDWSDRNNSILFADGAGAVVVGRSSEGEILQFSMGSDGSKVDSLYLKGGGSKNPLTLEGLERKEQYLRMDGKEIFKKAVTKMPESLLDAIKRSNLESSEIDHFLFHQANLRIINSIQKKLGVDKEKVLVNVDRYGNTSAATIPILLAEYVEKGVIKKGDLLGLSAFGAGLTWGSSVVRF